MKAAGAGDALDTPETPQEGLHDFVTHACARILEIMITAVLLKDAARDEMDAAPHDLPAEAVYAHDVHV